MADAEKREWVIEGLEFTLQESGWDANAAYDQELMIQVVTEAIALLKAQEPVEPVVDIDTWKCGICGHTLEHQELLGDNVLFHEQYNYCPECGRAVKWG